MRHIIDFSDDNEAALLLIGKLLSEGKRDILVLYDSWHDFKVVETQLLADFGESVLESGTIGFETQKNYRKEKNDVKHTLALPAKKSKSSR